MRYDSEADYGELGGDVFDEFGPDDTDGGEGEDGGEEDAEMWDEVVVEEVSGVWGEDAEAFDEGCVGWGGAKVESFGGGGVKDGLSMRGVLD